MVPPLHLGASNCKDNGIVESFPDGGIWMNNIPGSLSNGEMDFSSTKNQQKRDHQAFIDTSEEELFFIKKRALESLDNGATSGATLMNYSLWHDTCSSQSESHMADPHFFPRPFRSLNTPNKNDFSAMSAETNAENKGIEDEYDIDSCAPSSMSQTVDNPLYLQSGAKKVNINDVRITDHCLPEFVGKCSNAGEKKTFQRDCYNMLCGPAYHTPDVNTISIGQTSKGNGDLLLKNQYFNGVDVDMLSIGQSCNNVDYNTAPAIEQYIKSNSNFTSNSPYYNGRENFYEVDPFYGKSNGTYMSMSSVYDQDATPVPLRPVYGKENSVMLSLGENCERKGQTTIYFGDSRDSPEIADTSGRFTCSRDSLTNQPSSQSSVALGQRDYMEKLNANIVKVETSRGDGLYKSTEQKTKKGSSNNFPANVKSLLSTGILDGIPVKYVSWSREKNLRGVVKGTGYLCSCPDCNLSKVINAYEFERHADCKTKHPNNHIFFENGKTIYAVVQELRSTPQEMLFEVIQNVVGSPVNQKNFHAWKASYQAATRELQRIYGKD